MQAFLKYVPISWSFIVTFFTLSLMGCVEEFNPVITSYEKLLIVDGSITTEKASGVVRLGYSYPYDDHQKEEINDAIVILFDDIGNSYDFFNNGNSKYQIKDSNFIAQVGVSYKIYIELANGKVCESEFTQVLKPVAIDSVHYGFSAVSESLDGGLQFYLNLKNKSSQSDFFRWEYTETWEFKIPLASPTNKYHRTCYRYNNSNNINIRSTLGLVDKTIDDIPICIVKGPTEKFERKYGLLVKQHTLSKEDYIFYEKLKDLQEESGSFYDKTPYSLIGNMEYKGEGMPMVLGNFTVSSLSTKALFLQKIDVPNEVTFKTEFEGCAMVGLNYPEQENVITELIEKSGMTVVEKIPVDLFFEIYILASSMSCYDCSVTGTPVKPYFWNLE